MPPRELSAHEVEQALRMVMPSVQVETRRIVEEVSNKQTAELLTHLGKHDKRIVRLEKKNFVALIGWGGISVAALAVWGVAKGWVAKKMGWMDMP